MVFRLHDKYKNSENVVTVWEEEEEEDEAAAANFADTNTIRRMISIKT